MFSDSHRTSTCDRHTHEHTERQKDIAYTVLRTYANGRCPESHFSDKMFPGMVLPQNVTPTPPLLSVAGPARGRRGGRRGTRRRGMTASSRPAPSSPMHRGSRCRGHVRGHIPRQSQSVFPAKWLSWETSVKQRNAERYYMLEQKRKMSQELTRTCRLPVPSEKREQSLYYWSMRDMQSRR